MTQLQRARAEEVRHVEFRAADGSDGQTLEGYAAVFNAWTNIRDAQGSYREQIAPGAFKRSIGQRTPVLQFDHGKHPLVGSLPLGSISALREDRNGLFVKARLSDNWLVEPVRDAIRDGGISGMSFRFRVIDDEWGADASGDTRTIKEVELLELGPVVFPAYEQTSVAVRSLVGALSDEMRDALAAELGVPVYLDPTIELAGKTEPTRVGTFHRSCTCTDCTPAVAAGPAEVGSPDEPPAVSHEANRNRIAEALNRVGRHIHKET